MNAPPSQIQLTRFFNPSGDAVGKSYEVGPDGKPKKRSNISAFTSHCRVEAFDKVEGLFNLVESLPGSAHICAGVPRDGIRESKVTTKAKPRRGAITRTKDDLVFPDGPGLAYFDHDVAQAPEHLKLNIDALLDHITEILGVTWESLGFVYYTSSSSYVRVVETGSTTGEKGFHLLLAIKDACDAPRLIDAAFTRFVNAGLGYVFLGANGRPYVRTIIDNLVAEASRAIFAGGVDLKPGLACDRKFAYQENPPLDTRALVPDLTAAELRLFDETCEKLIAEAAPLAAEKERCYREAHINALLAKGIPTQKAESAYSSTAVSRLQGPWEIVLGNGDTITVNDILDNPAKFHNADCHCPLEGSQYHLCAKVFTDKGTSYISSWSHGGSGNGRPSIWVLERSPTTFFDILPPLPAPSAADVDATIVERAQIRPFPGAMDSVVEALLVSSPKQQPALSILAALIGMAAGCAGAYRLPSGMRLNLYGIGIAATGAGKDAPRHAAVEVARCANAALLGRPASGAGLEDELVSDRGMLVEIDEIAHLLAAASASKAPPHLVDLSAMLLKLFSASRGVYRTRAKAKVNNATASRLVENPTLNLLGFATPETLGAAVSAANITDGLLGRSLFAFGDANAPARRVRISFSLPESVKHQGEAIRQAVDVSALADGIGIRIADAAETRLAELTHDLDLQAKRHQSVHAQALTIRAAEKIERIAGVLSVWEQPSQPHIVLRHIDWAVSLVESSDSAALRFVETHMHGGKVQANAALVISIISRVLSGQLKPDRGLEEIEIRAGRAPKSLVLKRSKMNVSDLDEAIRHLEATEQIDVYGSGNCDARGRNRTTNSYILRGSV